MMARVMVGVREIDLMAESLPRSMRLAISTSPSRVSSGTVPISRRYIRTGSLVLSSAPGGTSRSISPAPSPVRSSSLSSRYVFSESTTSMPALPTVLNRSASSSEDVMSAGSSSLTSSYSRYPFSLPIEMSCLTSSYFSSIDNGMSSWNCGGLPGDPRGRGWLLHSVYLLRQIVHSTKECVHLHVVPRGSGRLQPIDLALDLGALAIQPQPFQDPHAIGRGGRGAGVAANFPRAPRFTPWSSGRPTCVP